MKNLTYFLLFGSLWHTSCESEKVVDQATLPAAEKQYLDTHFASIPISHVVRERRDNMTAYDVTLQNRIEVEFNAYGQPVGIDGQRTQRLPDSVIPSIILEYVKQKYADQYIVEWEKENRSQEIQLSNGTDLVFDLDGAFIRIDD